MSRTALSRNTRLAVICGVVFFAMVGAAFAAVPLYRMFCQVTGFDGTVRKADQAATRILDRTVGVRFDANVRDMPWLFTAEEKAQTVRIGETMEFPVVYFIDPAFATDPETKGKSEVTLSYTFFQVDGGKPAATKG